MNQKSKNILSVVITLLLAFGIIYFGNIYFGNKKDVSVVDQSSVEQLIKEETESQEENTKKREDQKKEESTNNSDETNKEDKGNEPSEKVQERHLEISKLSNDELIGLLENIFGMSPTESVAKYDVEYISGVLRVVGTRMNDMTDEQKQKIMKILEKSKPPQTKEEK